MSNLFQENNVEIFKFRLYEYTLCLRRYNGEIHVLTVEAGEIEHELYRSQSFEKSSMMFDLVAESIKKLVESQKTQEGIF